LSIRSAYAVMIGVSSTVTGLVEGFLFGLINLLLSFVLSNST